MAFKSFLCLDAGALFDVGQMKLPKQHRRLNVRQQGRTLLESVFAILEILRLRIAERLAKVIVRQSI